MGCLEHAVKVLICDSIATPARCSSSALPQEHVFSRMPPFETQEPRHALGRVATPHDTITMHRVSGNLVAREKHDSAVSRLTTLRADGYTLEHKCSKGSIEMRVGHNQWLQQPWDISQTRSRTMGRCEHRSNVRKRAPTITGTRVPGSWNTCSEGSREMRARPNQWLWGTRQHLMTPKLCEEFQDTSA